MELLNDIRLLFASLPIGAAQLQSLPEEYPAFVIRNSDGFGIAVELDEDISVSEHFANVHFYSTKMFLADEEKKVLFLQSVREDLRNEFACVCAQFADPGNDGNERIELISNPLGWWKKWKNLLGNSIVDKAPYSILSEMITLLRIYKLDHSAVWTGTTSGSHDIETESRSVEVKSTIQRYGASITVSGQFQLIASKPLELYFYRMEESPNGLSINHLVRDLREAGYDIRLLEQQLSSLGYESGASSRDKQYSVLETRLYQIDDAFPKITETSFKEDRVPLGITHIVYTVDLESIEYTPL